MIGGRIVAYPGRPGKMGLKERLQFEPEYRRLDPIVVYIFQRSAVNFNYKVFDDAIGTVDKFCRAIFGIVAATFGN